MAQSKLQKGFTLVELLVVIAIIASLATIGFVGAPKMLDRAKAAGANNALLGLTTGVSSFYADYGYYPDIPGMEISGFLTDADDDAYILDGTENAKEYVLALTGEEEEPEHNPKRIEYVTANQAKGGNTNGIDYAGNYGFFDPWGTPYIISVDTNYDGKVENPFKTGRENQFRTGVAALSVGADYETPGVISEDAFEPRRRAKVISLPTVK